MRTSQRSKKLFGDMLLLLCAAIWGSAFVFQKTAAAHMDGLSFNAMRFLLAAAAMYTGVLLRKKTAGKISGANIMHSIMCGFLLAAAINMQQLGLITSTVSKAGFITSLYVVFVPLIGIFIAHPISMMQIVSAVIAAAGLYFLSIANKFYLEFGDVFLLINAFFWALYILYLDSVSKHNDTFTFAAQQYFFCGFISAAASVVYHIYGAGGISAFFGKSNLYISALFKQTSSILVPILYTSIASVCIGFSLQIYAQRHVPPAHVTIIISMEAVFAMISGFLLLKEIPSAREFFGAALMFAAIVLTQVMPSKSVLKDSSPGKTSEE